MWVFDKISYKECCSCAACAQKCPRGAIHMTYNKEGFLYPSQNQGICTNCEICIRTCPIINASKLKNYGGKVIYAAQNKNENELLKSSSGGIFSLIAHYVLDKGGVVAGVAYDENLFLKHIIIEDSKGLEKLRGSKYFAAENDSIFADIKKRLLQGNLVCFSGTGCQVAALKSFLQKKYENLLTIDIVCHGTPSRKAFSYFLSEFERKRKVKVIDWRFRDKTIEGWQCSSSSSSSIDTKGNIVNHYFDKIFKSYFNAFISGDMYREGCYSCPFACSDRTGDLTLADYWGVEKYHKDIDTMNGVSAVLVNTPNGAFVFDEIIDKMYVRQSRIEWVSEVNKNLILPTPKTQRRESIYQELATNPKKVFDGYISNTQIAIQYIKYLIKKVLRKNSRLYHFLYQIKKTLIK